MSGVRKNTVVADFSVLPKRPNLELVQRFVEKGLGLDPKTLRSIQLHNIRHCVLLEMMDPDAAAETARKHHLKHTFRVKPDQKIPIPIYVDDDTIDVRVHDLPPDLPNKQIAEAMREFGEVLTIRDEVWKNFFIGIPNGVRVLKMKLSKPVPSFIKMCDFITLATHTGQIPTCRRCGLQRHVGTSCADQTNKPKKNPPAPVLLPPPAVAESQVVAPLSEDNNEGFTIVGKKGKPKRQLSEEKNNVSGDKRDCLDDDDDDENNTCKSTDDDLHDEHRDENGLRDEQPKIPTPKRRLYKQTN